MVLSCATFEFVEVVRREIAGGLLDEGVERRGVVGEADVDEAVDVAAVDGLQAVLGRVEVRVHVARPEQAAVELVGPLVVGADDLRVGSLRRAAEGRAAVAAGVVEGADRAVGAADDDDRVEADLVGDVAAGLRQLAGGHGEEPAPVPDPLEVELEDVGVGVEGARERVVGPAGGQQRQHIGILKHGYVLLTAAARLASMGERRRVTPDSDAPYTKVAAESDPRKNRRPLEKNSTPAGACAGSVGLVRRRRHQPVAQRPDGVAGLVVGVPAQIVGAGRGYPAGR